MLASWDQTLRETRAAASRAAQVLRAGFMSSAANEATQQIIAAFGVSPSQAGVAWPPANDADPVVQDFVRCCLDNKPAHPHDPA